MEGDAFMNLKRLTAALAALALTANLTACQNHGESQPERPEQQPLEADQQLLSEPVPAGIYYTEIGRAHV